MKKFSYLTILKFSFGIIFSILIVHLGFKLLGKFFKSKYTERQLSISKSIFEYSLIAGFDYYKYSKNFWLHAWGNIMPIHVNTNNEFSFHRYNGGQWTDYSAGLIFGHKLTKSLGLFAEGTYSKYWNRNWHKFSMGINYIIF